MQMIDEADRKSLFGTLLSIMPRDLGAYTCISYLSNMLINSYAIFSQKFVFLFNTLITQSTSICFL